MDSPIQTDTIWDYPLYILRGQMLEFPNYAFLSPKIVFILANSVDPDEMLQNAAFHLGLHCLPSNLFTD